MKSRTFIAFVWVLLAYLTLPAQEIEKNKDPKLAQFPDLFISSAQVDKAKSRVIARIANRGTAASISCKVKLVAIKTKFFTVIETVEYTLDVPALKQGERYTTAFVLPQPENEIITRPSKLLVDSGNVVKEFREDNNEWSFSPKTIQATRSFSPDSTQNTKERTTQ